MKHSIDLVREFHTAFGHPVASHINTPDADVRLLRYKLIMEEALEFGRAIGVSGLVELNDSQFNALVKSYLGGQHISPAHEPDLVEAADALGDIDYVVQGANLVFGFPSHAVTEEIHTANMSKLGADGKPIYDAGGKVQKGPNYRKPDVAAVLKRHGHEPRTSDMQDVVDATPKAE